MRSVALSSVALYSLVVVHFLTACEVFGQAPPAAASKLILLDGSSVAFQSLDVTAGKLSGDSVPSDLTLDDLRRIDVSAPLPATAEKPAILAELRGGGRFFAKSVSIANDKCNLTGNIGEPLSLPLDLLRGIRLGPAVADFEKSLAAPHAELDRVFVRDEAGKPSVITGLVESLTDQQLAIEISGQVRNVPCDRVLGLVIAQPAMTDPVSRCLVTFRDGSMLGGDTLSLSGNKAELGFPAGASVSFDWSSVSRVTIRSSRVAFLSDLKPIAEEQQPIVTFPRPAQRDKSVSGKPLTLGAKIFDKGLGVHSRSSLTFAADKKWDWLAATVGIDAAAAGKGDCLFSLVVDGQTIYTRRVQGTDPPYEIQVSITDREQVTLLVEPGEGLDLADHANWCDVRFMKDRAK